MGADTLEKPKQAAPSSHYVNKGLQDLKNHANQGADKSPGGIRGKVGNQLENHMPGGKAMRSLNDLRKGNLSQGAGTLTKEGIKELAKLAVKAAIANPEFSIPAATIVVVILFVVFMLVGPGSTDSTDTTTNTGQQAEPLKLTKTGPAQAKLNDTLPYTISVTYAGSADNITITDPLPQGTAYVSSTPTASVSGTTLTWDAKALALPLANPVAITINVVLKATQDNLTIANIASATVVAGASSEGFTTAIKDNCGGKDQLGSNPLGNYGDPDCKFSKDELYTYLKQNDPQYADIWFLQVVPKECSYNPNAWAPPIGVQGTLDVGGAWGCFQMGSSFPPGIAPDPANQASYGKNDYSFTKTDNMVLDRGDVNWKLQAHNAIMYNRIRLHCSFTYWGSITNLWNKYHC